MISFNRILRLAERNEKLKDYLFDTYSSEYRKYKGGVSLEYVVSEFVDNHQVDGSIINTNEIVEHFDNEEEAFNAIEDALSDGKFYKLDYLPRDVVLMLIMLDADTIDWLVETEYLYNGDLSKFMEELKCYL